MSTCRNLGLAIFFGGVVAAQTLAVAQTSAAQPPAAQPPATQPAGWAIFSPDSAAKLHSQAGTEAGRWVLQAAEAVVNETPHPRARIHTEGTLPHQGIRDESLAAEKDWAAMLDLGLAYRLSGDKKFLAAEDRYLSAWTSIYHSSFDPIDETNMDQIMLAYDLTRGDLSPKTETQASTLWKSMAVGYIEWMEHNGGRDPRNWSSHRVKLAVMAAYETGDPKLEARAAEVFHEQVKRNIRSDGSVEDFYERDALHYVVYDLDPLQMAALAAKGHGEDWFHEGAGGKNIAHAIDWLVPYAIGDKKHEEFVHSNVGFDAARDKAGEKGYSGEWDPANGVQTLTLAALLDSHYMTSARQSITHSGHGPQPWQFLFAAVTTHP